MALRIYVQPTYVTSYFCHPNVYDPILRHPQISHLRTPIIFSKNFL